MKTDDMVLVSVDDHIIEPPDLFTGHISKEYLSRAPQLVRTAEGTDVWQFGSRNIENSALNAVAGRPKEEYGLEPQGLDEIRPGCYDHAEQVKDMNAGGVLASMNFPSFPGFAARLFATEDEEFSLALVRAYNDWHIDEWCGSHPGRFNAMRGYSFDPFSVIPREQATVGALRHTAGDHDVSIQSRSTRITDPDTKVEAFRRRAQAAVDAGLTS